MRWYEGQCAVCQRQNPGFRQDPRPRQGDTQPEPEADPAEELEAARNEEFCYRCKQYTYLGRNSCSNPSCRRKGQSRRGQLDRSAGREEVHTFVPWVQRTADLPPGGLPAVARNEAMSSAPLPTTQGMAEQQEGLCSLPQPSSHRAATEIQQRLIALAQRAQELANESSGSDEPEVLEKLGKMEAIVSDMQMAVCNGARR